MRETPQRILKECLANLKEIKRQKQALREHFSHRINESRSTNRSAVKRYVEAKYNDECNGFVDDCQEELAMCCRVPEIRGCWKGVCTPNGCVYDDCSEEEFDCAVDNSIETLGWLVVPCRVRC